MERGLVMHMDMAPPRREGILLAHVEAATAQRDRGTLATPRSDTSFGTRLSDSYKLKPARTTAKPMSVVALIGSWYCPRKGAPNASVLNGKSTA